MYSKRWGTLTLWVMLVLVLLQTVNAQVQPIVIQNANFYYETGGNPFFVRGVYYSQINRDNETGTREVVGDAMADGPSCERDIPILRKMTTNAVTVSGFDPQTDHTACLQAFQDNNIYVMVDLSSLAETSTLTEWTTDLFHNYTAQIDQLSSYSNILGMYVAYDVIRTLDDTAIVPFMKAAFRDLHSYIRYKNYRNIPLGYAASSGWDAPNQGRDDLTAYILCAAESADDVPDFLGWAEFEWCGDTDSQTTGIRDATRSWNFDIPKIFAEYPLICDSSSGSSAGDNYDIVRSLYGPDLIGNWSGGFVSQYTNDSDDNGLVNHFFDNVVTLSAASVYSSIMATLNPGGSTATAFNPDATPTNLPACPTTGTEILAAPTALPPQPFDELCECMARQVGCTWNGDGNATESISSTCSNAQGAGCAGIDTNIQNGQYGAYSVCNATAQEIFLVNRAWEEQGSSDPSSCSMDGSLVSPSPPAPQGLCSSLLQQAGSAGTQTVTATPGWLGGSTIAGYSIPTAGAAGSDSSSSSSSSSSSASSGLSTGAQAGIGVGVAAGFISLVVLGLFLLRKRRQQQKQAEPKELDATPEPPQMLASNQRVEMPSHGVATELDTKQVPVELPADEPVEKMDDEPLEKHPDGIDGADEDDKKESMDDKTGTL